MRKSYFNSIAEAFKINQIHMIGSKKMRQSKKSNSEKFRHFLLKFFNKRDKVLTFSARTFLTITLTLITIPTFVRTS